MGLNVPRDLAVVGFDDTDEATQTVPQITTARQPILEIANLSFYLLTCAIQDRSQRPPAGSWRCLSRR